MAVTVTHAFVSAIADSDDTSLVRPSDWNASHTIAGLGTAAEANTADLLARANHTGTQLAATISDFSTAADARVSAAIGSTVQAYSANLDEWSGINPSANGGSLVAAANYAAMRGLLDLEIGTDVQAWSANLDEYAAVNPTAAGLALLGDATASDQRTTLGLGTAAVKNTGTSGDAIPLLNTAVTFNATSLTVYNTGAFVPALITEADANGATGGYVQFLKGRAGGPAQAADAIGTFLGRARDSASAYQNAAFFGFEVVGVGSGFVDGLIRFQTSAGGSGNASITLKNGLYDTGATGTDKGVGSLNFRTLWYNGVQLSPPGAPVTKTGDFTVAASEKWLIINKGSACTVTLPLASSFPGRELNFTNIGGAFTTVSASSNVVPRAGGAAATSILPGTDGAWARLVSDGTNWIIMQSS